MSVPADPAEADWNDAWRQAKQEGFVPELHAVLEYERRRLDEASDGGDRTFEAPMGRSDCIHGLYFEGVFDRAVEAAREAAEEHNE